MWNCIEDRIEQGGKFGRIIRKLVFEDIYSDRNAVLSQNPIARNTLPHLKTGDRVAFYDNCEIREGQFLCSSQKEPLDAKTILSEVLSTEDELRNFCQTYKISGKNDHVFTMAIEAFLFLMQKMKSDNTSTVLNRFQVQGQPRQPVVANRKRTLPIELDDRSVQPVAQRLVRNEIRETSPIKPVNRPKPDIVTIHTGQQPITPPVMPINAGRLPMHPGMPPANIQRHSPGQPTPMPRPPPAPVTGHPINIPRLSPGQQPIIPPLRMPIPEPTKLESSDVLELNMGEDKDTDTSQTSEPPQPWKQFVVESLEGNQPANGQGVKTEFSDDTLEVIDCNSDSEPGPIMPFGLATGTDMVPINPPQSSNVAKSPLPPVIDVYTNNSGTLERPLIAAILHGKNSGHPVLVKIEEKYYKAYATSYSSRKHTRYRCKEARSSTKCRWSCLLQKVKNENAEDGFYFHVVENPKVEHHNCTPVDPILALQTSLATTLSANQTLALGYGSPDNYGS